MNLAIIGSRTFNDYAHLCAVLAKVKTPITCIVSGGAKGADLLAERWAVENGIPTKVFLPDYSTHGRSAPLVRNRLIVGAADSLLAFWDGASTGTAYTIRKAQEAGKKVAVIQF